MTHDTAPIHIGDPSANSHLFLDAIPADKAPTRVALTPNLLIPLKTNGNIFLLYHNFDPVHWNQWYPVFTFYRGALSNPPAKARELVNFVEMYSDVSSHFEMDVMLRELADKACEVTGLDHIEIAGEPLIKRDYWLKYSQTANQWTLYCYIFFRATAVVRSSRLSNLGDPLLALVPIEAQTFNGVSVVENTIELLAIPAIRAAIVNNAISI